MSDATRQPVAVLGAKLVLLGALVVGVWQVVRAELDR